MSASIGGHNLIDVIRKGDDRGSVPVVMNPYAP